MRCVALLLFLLTSGCLSRTVPPAEPLPPTPAPGQPTPPIADAAVPAPAPQQAPPAPAPPAPESRPVTVLVGGDVTIGHHYQTYFDEQVGKGRTREEMFAYGFKEVKAAAQGSDLFVVNLECPFTERGEKLAKNFNFRARPELVQVLKAGGVQLVSLANNHMMDYGPQGLLDTLETLESAGIAWFGAGRTLAEARRPALITVEGVRIAFLGYFFLGTRNIEPPEVYATDTTPGVAGHFSDEAEMERMLREDIRAARAQADVVLPYFHWGREGTQTLEPYQVRLARAAIDAGASGVLGAHPHVLQAMELYKGAPVVYSLGNFVFGGNWNPRDKRSALFRARFSREGYMSAEVVPLRTDRYPEFPIQPSLVSGEAALEVMRLLSTSSEGVPRMLPELETWRQAAPSP